MGRRLRRLGAQVPMTFEASVAVTKEGGSWLTGVLRLLRIASFQKCAWKSKSRLLCLNTSITNNARTRMESHLNLAGNRFLVR